MPTTGTSIENGATTPAGWRSRNIVALSRPDRHARLAVRTVVDLLADIGAALRVT